LQIGTAEALTSRENLLWNAKGKENSPALAPTKQPGRQDKMRPQPRAEKKIRVNAVAPGPNWTPLTPSTFPANEVATFGSDTPLG